MGYLELGVLIVAVLGFLCFAAALAWIDADPRRRSEMSTKQRTD